jgi:uncharacterized protein YjbI with pentapeptide repeats
MANQEHLELLRQGVDGWNRWRQDNTQIEPDLSHASLYGLNLTKANLDGANLSRTDLRRVELHRAKLKKADLSYAILSGASFRYADLNSAKLVWSSSIDVDFLAAHLEGADLTSADLTSTNFRGTHLRGAHLNGANLTAARFIESDLENSDLTASRVYGASVWDTSLEGATQRDLIITRLGEPTITVDNLNVAQFIYLLLDNATIREVIDTVTSKAVLILGRFTKERKAVLDALRDELRRHDYLPILFDFEKPESKDLTGTVTTLANMARFIIADLTDPSSVPHELATVVPSTMIPVQAILLGGQREYAMFADLKRRHHWVLEPYRYESQQELLKHLGVNVIAPAEAKAKELMRK